MTRSEVLLVTCRIRCGWAESPDWPDWPVRVCFTVFRTRTRRLVFGQERRVRGSTRVRQRGEDARITRGAARGARGVELGIWARRGREQRDEDEGEVEDADEDEDGVTRWGVASVSCEAAWIGVGWRGSALYIIFPLKGFQAYVEFHACTDTTAARILWSLATL